MPRRAQNGRDKTYSFTDIATYLRVCPKLLAKIGRQIGVLRRQRKGNYYELLTPIQAKMLLAAYHSRLDKPSSYKL